MNNVRDRIKLYLTLSFLLPIGLAALTIGLGIVSGYVMLVCALIWSFCTYRAHHVECPKCSGRIRLLIPFKYRCSRCDKYY